jgi:two-component system cell cycle sensor histidine kinase/response regulator CckA
VTVDSAELQRQLLDCVPMGLTVWQLVDPADARSLRLVYANAAASRHTGVDLSGAIGQAMAAILPTIGDDALRLFADVCRDRAPCEQEMLYSDARVPASTFLLKAIPLLEGAVAILFENLTAQKRAEAETVSLNRFLDSIIEHIPTMVFLKDAKDLRFERFNRAGEELLGRPRSAMIGKTDYDFFPKEQADFFVAKDRAVLHDKTLQDILEEPIDTPNGMRWLHTKKIPLLDESGEATHLLGISLDITERKQAEEVLRTSHEDLERRVALRTSELRQQIEERVRAEDALALAEEQLRQAQKMEAIGQLAGGIAHDFNNLLSVVLTYCEVLLQRLPANDELRSPIQEIHRAGRRAADLTRQLLAFSRQQVLQPRTLDLCEVVSGMQSMLSRLLGEDIDLDINVAKPLHRVKADPSQIDQVIMNLVVNARDAMRTGGKLTITLANVDLDERDGIQALADDGKSPRLSPSAHVMLAVRDSGVGMSTETLARIFEPFFTTKDKGKGTGLGLSTVFGIVKQSGGSIAVDSEPGQGATFRIYLPATIDTALSEPPSPSTAPVDLRGSETIVLVEDDDQVRVLTANILRAQGYRLLECARPSEAIARVAAHTGPIDLLLTDVVMPEMGGRALAEMLVAHLPSLRVIFMSGYTDDAIVRHGVLEAGVAFVQKPITPKVLARCVRSVLDTPGHVTGQSLRAQLP